MAGKSGKLDEDSFAVKITKIFKIRCKCVYSKNQNFPRRIKSENDTAKIPDIIIRK
jgi:hypothetical protein